MSADDLQHEKTAVTGFMKKRAMTSQRSCLVMKTGETMNFQIWHDTFREILHTGEQPHFSRIERHPPHGCADGLLSKTSFINQSSPSGLHEYGAHPHSDGGVCAQDLPLRVPGTKPVIRRENILSLP